MSAKERREAIKSALRRLDVGKAITLTDPKKGAYDIYTSIYPHARAVGREFDPPRKFSAKAIGAHQAQFTRIS